MKISEVSLVFAKARFLEACANWRDYPSKPAIYVLAVSEPFKHIGKITDIVYIGETKHFGCTPSNNRLWDYHTQATQHERDIVEKIKEIENTGKFVDIWWSYDWPKKYTRKEYEKHLLRQYSEEHGRLPILNKRE